MWIPRETLTPGCGNGSKRSYGACAHVKRESARRAALRGAGFALALPRHRRSLFCLGLRHSGQDSSRASQLQDELVKMEARDSARVGPFAFWVCWSGQISFGYGEWPKRDRTNLATLNRKPSTECR